MSFEQFERFERLAGKLQFEAVVSRMPECRADRLTQCMCTPIRRQSTRAAEMRLNLTFEVSS